MGKHLCAGAMYRTYGLCIKKTFALATMMRVRLLIWDWKRRGEEEEGLLSVFWKHLLSLSLSLSEEGRGGGGGGKEERGKGKRERESKELEGDEERL